MSTSREKSPIEPISVGSLVKKIHEMNRNLGVQAILEIIKESSNRERHVDEERALLLARSRID